MGTYMCLKHLQSLDDKKVVLRCLWQTLLQAHSFLYIENKEESTLFLFTSSLFFPIHIFKTVNFNK